MRAPWGSSYLLLRGNLGRIHQLTLLPSPRIGVGKTWNQWSRVTQQMQVLFRRGRRSQAAGHVNNRRSRSRPSGSSIEGQTASIVGDQALVSASGSGRRHRTGDDSRRHHRHSSHRDHRRHRRRRGRSRSTSAPMGRVPEQSHRHPHEGQPQKNQQTWYRRNMLPTPVPRAQSLQPHPWKTREQRHQCHRRQLARRWTPPRHPKGEGQVPALRH